MFSSRVPSCPHCMIPPQGFLLTSLVYISNVVMFFRILFFCNQTRYIFRHNKNRSLAPSIKNMSIKQSKTIKSQIQLHHPRQERSFHCSPEPCGMTLIPSFVVHRHSSRSKFEDLLTSQGACLSVPAAPLFWCCRWAVPQRTPSEIYG